LQCGQQQGAGLGLPVFAAGELRGGEALLINLSSGDGVRFQINIELLTQSMKDSS
jgi:hypothetical protein